MVACLLPESSTVETTLPSKRHLGRDLSSRFVVDGGPGRQEEDWNFPGSTTVSHWLPCRTDSAHCELFGRNTQTTSRRDSFRPQHYWFDGNISYAPAERGVDAPRVSPRGSARGTLLPSRRETPSQPGRDRSEMRPTVSALTESLDGQCRISFPQMSLTLNPVTRTPREPGVRGLG